MFIPLISIIGYLIILPFYFEWDYIPDPWTLTFKFIGILSVLICLGMIYVNMKKRWDFVV